MVFDGGRYHALCGKGLEIARQDFICYDITTTKNLGLGDRVSYQGRKLVVCRREIGYSGSMVVFRSRLAGKAYASAVEECSPYLAGLTLEGSATRRVGEACGVFVDEALARERKVMGRGSLAAALSGESAYLYPYVPVTGNLMYSMPGKGARVKLELRSCREGSAVVSACLHGNCREPWEPGERMLCAEYGGFSRQLGIAPGSCTMGTNGVGSVSLDDRGVEMWTAGMLLMYAGEKIRVEGRVQALLRTRSGILANSGRQASSLWLGGRQDWLAPYTVLHGRVYREHACYQDAPQKGHFNWGKYLVNVTQGLQVIVVVGGAALASKNKALSLAAINAAMKLCSMSVADYQSGNVRDTWQSKAQVTLSAVEGGLYGAVGVKEPFSNRVAAHTVIGVEFGKLDRALEYHELLFTDFEAWKKEVNDPKALSLDVVWSIVPDIIIEVGGKIGAVIKEARERWKMPVVHVTDLGYVVDDLHPNGNLLKVGASDKIYSVIPKNMNGSITKQFYTELAAIAGSSRSVGVPRNLIVGSIEVVFGGNTNGWDVPGVGNYVGNPDGVYGIVPGDMDGSRVPEVDTARAVVVGGEGGSDIINSTIQILLDALKDAPVEYRKNPKTGIMEPYMKQVQVSDDYKVILRRDIGDFNHGDLDHWNLEVQTVQGGNIKYDLHLYLGADGNLLPFTEDNIYIPKKSPFK